MNLNDTLTAIAAQISVPAIDLIRYAAEDHIGGFDFDENRRQWPTGSIWAVEGKVLYALVRALRPLRCLELGTHQGCSAAHVASALQRNGDGGQLICVDLRDNFLQDVPRLAEFDNVTLIQGDGVAQLTQQRDNFDLVFEDMDHSTEQVALVWQAARPKLNPGGLLVSHDAMHFLVGADVRAGIELIVPDAKYYLSEPADCGLAIWQKPGERKPRKTATKTEKQPLITGDDIPTQAAGESVIEKPAAKPKRTPRKRKPKVKPDGGRNTQ